MIQTENLTRKYGDFTAVEGVSFRIERGEIIGLLGHNGAGKTTIMKMLTGYLEPTAGTILVDGLDIAEERTRVQAKVGYLPENCPLYLEMTVIDYLEYAAGLRGIEGDSLVRTVADAIERTDLWEKATQPITTLSRGFRQRVGVAQAILGQPQILILDEPTNGLDPSQIHHMRDLIRDLGRHSTIILSTHILQEVQAVAERVLIMQNGRLALDSRLSELQSGRKLLLTINRGPETAKPKLSAIEGIEAVEFLCLDGDRHRYALTLTGGRADGDAANVAPRVARQVIAQGLELYALHPEVRNIETVFQELNASRREITGGTAHAA